MTLGGGGPVMSMTQTETVPDFWHFIGTPRNHVRNSDELQQRLTPRGGPGQVQVPGHGLGPPAGSPTPTFVGGAPGPGQFQVANWNSSSSFS